MLWWQQVVVVVEVVRWLPLLLLLLWKERWEEGFVLVWVEEWRRSLGVVWWLMRECAHLRGSVVVVVAVVVVEVHSKLVWQVQLWVRGVLCHGSRKKFVG